MLTHTHFFHLQALRRRKWLNAIFIQSTLATLTAEKVSLGQHCMNTRVEYTNVDVKCIAKIMNKLERNRG